MLWHAYIDESGDRGWKRKPANLPVGKREGSSRTFALTAVLVPDGTQKGALAAWDRAGLEIGRRPGDPIHWVNVKSPGQRSHLVNALISLAGVQTISVVLCKHHLPNAEGLHDVDRLYNWTLRLLVERMSWFGNHRGDVVGMTFSQVLGMDPKKLHTYIDVLSGIDTYIRWSALKLPARIDTPRNRRMLQIADTASGAVFAAFEPDPWNFTTREYLERLKPVIWCRSWRPLYKDGLKYGPWPDTNCAVEHDWFQDFCDSA
jgi:hypothetical protein